MLDPEILDNFPKTGLSLVFGYGSRVVEQATNATDSMTDIIFAVDDPVSWHQENLLTNSHHYSAIKYFRDNSKKITNIQDNFGANIYYNPFVRVDGVLIKYGVIRTHYLIQDLNKWTQLYVAGRLHKPIELLFYNSENTELKTALRFNKESALRAALLQLPESFDTIDLYRTIARLSYSGDIRMRFGEHKNKIDNIVCHQIKKFDELYSSVIKMNTSLKDYVSWNEASRTISQDKSPAHTYRNLCLLPNNLKSEICSRYGPVARSYECEAAFQSLSRNIECEKVVASAVASIVFRSSLSQSLKGILTAGLAKSLRYGRKKITKSLNSRLSGLFR